ncbi:hypothetical protein OSG_eHP14_00010 [environmental Halophage eHP-14]|nr:hypothetical protein OSG_eHP14_00010 [environmental Halophage eHP-14]
MQSDNICGAETRNGEPCERTAGWGTGHLHEGRCKQHGGKDREKGGAPAGEDNGNYDHGGFAEKIDADEIIEAFEQAADPNNLDPVWLRLAGESYARYQRTDDARHLAECRRCLENAGDEEDSVTLGDIELAADFSDG